MTNGDEIRNLDNEGLTDFLLCVKCRITTPGHCFYRKEQAVSNAIFGDSDRRMIIRCAYWHWYNHWLDEEAEVITSKLK